MAKLTFIVKERRHITASIELVPKQVDRHFIPVPEFVYHSLCENVRYESCLISFVPDGLEVADCVECQEALSKL